jgi:hypothetical protein
MPLSERDIRRIGRQTVASERRPKNLRRERAKGPVLWQPGLIRAVTQGTVGGRSGSTLGTGTVRFYDYDPDTNERAAIPENQPVVNDYPGDIDGSTDVWVAWYRGALWIAIENCEPNP